MALTQKDKKQVNALLIVLAIGAAAAFWYWVRTPMVAEVSSLQQEIDSLRTNIDSARADLARGTVQQLRDRVVVYEGSLALMRQLVPDQNEVADLIDQVSTQAQLRGVTVTDIGPLAAEYEVPFEVHRYRFTVEGTYDEIGEFLADVASLDRIMVPYDFTVDPAPSGCPGIQEGQSCLAATFLLRTFVKTNVEEVFGAGVSP
jgi:type IV pilus assembly protein PilO